MRLVLLDAVPIDYGGGYERFVLAFGRSAAAGRHRVALLTPSPTVARLTNGLLGIDLGPRQTRAHADVHLTDVELHERSPLAARQVTGDADILYVKNEPHELAFARALKPARARLVVGFHSSMDRGGDGRGWRARVYRSRPYRTLLSSADLCHVLRRADAEFLVARCGVDPNRIVTVPNGTDLDQFSPSSATPPTSHFRLLFVGRLDFQKGIDLLLGSMRIIAETSAKVTLTIAGDGPLRTQVDSAVHSHERISATGHDSDPAALYAGHDLVVAPSRWEVFSLVPAEALASGVPVLLADIPANSPYRGCEAVSSAPPDEQAIADRILGLYEIWRDRRSNYAQLRQRARSFAAEHLDQREAHQELLTRMEKICVES